MKNITYFLVFSILNIFLFSSCATKTIDQQVESIMKSNDAEKRKTASYSLADSLSNRPAELFFGLYADPRASESLENILTRYLYFISSNSFDTKKTIECIRYITEPNTVNDEQLNKLKINLIVSALQIRPLDEISEGVLIKAARLHGETAMYKIINEWYNNRSSATLLKAVQGFNTDAMSYLINNMDKDTAAVDLLARFGKPVVNTMLEKMKDNEQSVRFAAGDVLVQMLKYDPSAVNLLTSAIDQNGIKTIAKNYPFYIRLGQNGTEKLILKALDSYFDKDMCLDCLNCGNSELETGATEIASKNGYWVTRNIGSHFGPKWGSGN